MITLQRRNVVRKVASEEAARKLEEQGFARTGGIADMDNPGVELQIDLDALADKVADIIKAGNPLTDEPAAKAKGGKAAKAGAAHDGA